MKLVLEASGARFDVYSVDLSDDPLLPDNPVRAFLDGLARGPQRTLIHLFNEHKDHGPIYNEQRSRPLWDDIYEWKADQGPGWRLYYFNLGRRTIVTHGSQKRKRSELGREVERAKSIREVIERSGL